MKLLWVNANFLHPTTKGGQIRTLEMLKRLHQRHQVHYAALENPQEPEGVARSGEYSARAYPFRLDVPSKGTPRFYAQAAAGAFQSLPVAVSRFQSREMAQALTRLMDVERFDAMVCDFLVSAVHFPHLDRALLFQHNVETMIWRRHAEHAANPLARAYLDLQARRMFTFERDACRKAAHVAAVSEQDASIMRNLFGVERVSAIPTGVDLDYFAPQAAAPVADLVFVGSMDWQPNVDGVTWFFNEVFPLIRAKRPQTKVAIVGRTPPPSVAALPALVTGTVPDVRPYLWGTAVSIVPLRIGGGTRLKIYESMAARVPVVSTTIGAEGLAIAHGRNILLADSPQDFGQSCLDLLDNADRRATLAEAAWQQVATHFSWDQVACAFERILHALPR